MPACVYPLRVNRTSTWAAGAAKNARDPAILTACRNGIVRYLESLRALVPATLS